MCESTNVCPSDFINKRYVDQVSTGGHRLFPRHEFLCNLKNKETNFVIENCNPKELDKLTDTLLQIPNYYCYFMNIF